MPRPLDSARRAELVEQTVRYAAQHGIATIALRPLAAALGTSSRMLVHYFGTKENLIEQVLAALRPDVPTLLAGHVQAGHTPSQVATLFWKDLSEGEQVPRLQLLLQIMVLALTQPDQYGRFARDAIRTWTDPLIRAFRDAGVPERSATARASLLVSGLRGLALDRYLTQDRRRTDDAAALLIAAAMTADTPSSVR